MNAPADAFATRLRAAQELMERQGLRRAAHAPPLYRLMWKLGLRVPPPHMGGFASNALLMGGFFGVFWGLVMWLILWGRQGMPLAAAAIAALTAGVLFGTLMAAYFRWSAGKRAIPRWENFHP